MTSIQYLNALYRNITHHSPAMLRKKLPSEIGEGHIFQTRTRQGIALSDWRMKYSADMHVHGIAGSDYVQIIFCMNAPITWEDRAQSTDLGIHKGESCLYRCSDEPEHICYRKDCDFHFKSLKIPVSYLNQILTEYLEDAELDHLQKKLYLSPVKAAITPHMEKVLLEMTDSAHYSGGFAFLYLESKALELISVYLHALSGAADGQGDRRLSPTDRTALTEVKRIMDGNIAAAPSCDALARQAGLSTTKFTRGFHSMYGMPVHAYIIDKRLEKAAMLLTERELNVGQIAMLVGYSNASHFAAAFRRKYGLSPKQYAGA